MSCHYIPDLAAEVAIPPDGILSRTLHNDDDVRAVLFGFSAGQELTEHTSKMPAILHVLHGEARLQLGDELVEAHPGGWVHMPAGLVHGIYAKTPLIVLLLLLKSR